MWQEIRAGLGLLAFSAIGGLIYLAGRPTPEEQAAFGDPSTGAQFAQLAGGLSLILAIVALLLIAVALLRNRSDEHPSPRALGGRFIGVIRRDRDS